MGATKESRDEAPMIEDLAPPAAPTNDAAAGTAAEWAEARQATSNMKRRTIEALASEEKVEVFISADSRVAQRHRDGKGRQHPVVFRLNGVEVPVSVGERVEVPVSVGELVEYCLKGETEAAEKERLMSEGAGAYYGELSR